MGKKYDQIGDDFLQYLRQKLRERPELRARDKQGSIWICCPFHSERTPSCKVTIGDSEFLPGTFYCFGCGESGGWNKLAVCLGYRPVKLNSVKALLQASVRLIDTRKKQKMLSDRPESVSDLLEYLGYREYLEWPDDDSQPIYDSWRGVKGSLLHKIGAHLIMENDETRAFLPVQVNGRTVGGIRTSLSKKLYLTTEGEWVKERGLFPFDYTKRLIDRYWSKPFVVLVEGPRDALRLLSLGVPALAILGAKNWSSKKTIQLSSLNLDLMDVYTMFDPDRAGKAASKQVKGYLGDLFLTKNVKLPPVIEDEKGDLIKCDPFNVPLSILKPLIQQLRTNYGWKK